MHSKFSSGGWPRLHLSFVTLHSAPHYTVHGYARVRTNTYLYILCVYITLYIYIYIWRHSQPTNGGHYVYIYIHIHIYHWNIMPLQPPIRRNLTAHLFKYYYVIVRPLSDETWPPKYLNIFDVSGIFQTCFVLSQFCPNYARSFDLGTPNQTNTHNWDRIGTNQKMFEIYFKHQI